jgi:hypothetical protein
MESNPPLGMWQATGEVGSKIPTLPEIRNGAFADEGWTHEGQMEHRGTNPHEIHARRVARTSSASTRTRKSSITPNTPEVIQEERHEFFPKRAPTTPVQEPLFEVDSSAQPSEMGYNASEQLPTVYVSPIPSFKKQTNKLLVLKSTARPQKPPRSDLQASFARVSCKSS